MGTWLAAQGLPKPAQRAASVHLLSRSAIEAVAAGQGIALAQMSFASADLALGRLIRLSQASSAMPEPYYICWGPGVMENDTHRNFLNWVLSEAPR